MRTFMKIIIAGAGAVVVVVIALTIFAKIIITPERIREAVIPVAEKALGRSVQLGDISISLFSGIVLHDLRIIERDSDDVFLSAAQASLRYRLLPLLSLQVVIDEVRIEEPHIAITRMPDKTFNFSDLIAEDPKPVTENQRREQPAQSGGLPVSLTIATVRLNKGSVVFVDKAAGTAGPIRHTISGLTVAARDITDDRAFPIELACRLNEAVLKIDGRADLRSRSARARIDLTNLASAALLPYIADMIPGRLNSLTANLSAQVEGDSNRISASGTLTLRGIDLILKDLPDAPIRGANLSTDFDTEVDLNTSAVQLRSTRLNYNGITAQVSGRIEQRAGGQFLALDVSAPGLSIPAVMAALPPGLIADASSMNPTGAVDLQARLEGAADSAAVLKSADVRLRDVQANLGSMRPAVSGSLQLTADRLSSQDLVLEAAGSRASIELTAQNLFSAPIITTQRISAERFDIDALFAPPPKGGKGSGSKQPSLQQKQSAPAEEIGPFDLPVRADGTVKIARALYKGLVINDFHCAYGLVDNILTIDSMTGSVAGGSFAHNGRIDLGRRGLAYQNTLSLQGLQADPVLSAFLPGVKNTFFGTVNLDLKADGQGTLPDTFKKNLDCTSKLNLTDGRITGLALAKGLADFLNLQELRELRFDTFGGTINIARGQARLETEMTGSDVRMQPAGMIGLDGSLDIRLNAALSPALVQKLDKRGQASSFLADQQGWAHLPLQIKGTVEKPRFSLDSAGVRQQVQEKVIDTLQQRLRDRMAPPPTQDSPPSDAPAQELQDTPRQSDTPQESSQPDEQPKSDREKKREERRRLLENTLRDVLTR